MALARLAGGNALLWHWELLEVAEHGTTHRGGGGGQLGGQGGRAPERLFRQFDWLISSREGGDWSYYCTALVQGPLLLVCFGFDAAVQAGIVHTVQYAANALHSTGIMIIQAQTHLSS